MNSIARDLTDIVENVAGRLRAIPEPPDHSPQTDGHWSAKQVLGHLIDSAANNHQRFVRAQATDDLVFPGYDQEQWVRVQRYDEESWLALVELWRGYNLHLAHVIAMMPESELTRPRFPHTLDKIGWRPVRAEEPTTLEYLVRDYIDHLQDHVGQLFAAAKS